MTEVTIVRYFASVEVELFSISLSFGIIIVWTADERSSEHWRKNCDNVKLIFKLALVGEILLLLLLLPYYFKRIYWTEMSEHNDDKFFINYMLYVLANLINNKSLKVKK